MNEKFFYVNDPHTYQLHNNTFFIGIEVQAANIKKKPQDFVMMFSKEQMEDIIFYYNQSVNREL